MIVSEIGLGANAVGGHNLFDGLREEEGKAMIDSAIHLGINFIDTADIYGKGRSEELIGEVLSAHKRDNIILATKGGRRWFEDGTVVLDNNPSYLRKALEDSLSRLKTDYVDLYYLHFPDNKTPLMEAIGELSKLKQEGKIRAIGVSNVSLSQLKEANEHGDISVLQSAYSLLNRSAEKEILLYTREANISFVPYGPLAFGLLGGNYTKEFKLTMGDWRHSNPLFQERYFADVLDKVDLLKKLAVEKGTNIVHLSLAWLLNQDGIDSVIPGGKRREHVERNINANDLILTTADLTRIDEILSSDDNRK
nr:aldo/keto reductase [Paenibacillus periandrae]